jgi:DNA-binding IclR family transcriptional regulator
MACLSRHYHAALNDLPVRILSEFDDQPGLRLTFSQIRRLWDVSEAECGDALAYLLRNELLRRDANGRYCLAGLKECTPWISS